MEYVLHYYGIPQCVCFGVGLGANVLARFARRRPTMVDGLVLFNCSSQGGICRPLRQSIGRADGCGQPAMISLLFIILLGHHWSAASLILYFASHQTLTSCEGSGEK